MSESWYYADDKGAVGPMSLDALNGTLTTLANVGDMLVWREGFTDWRRVGDVPELRKAPVPPPLPRQSKARSPVPEVALKPDLAGNPEYPKASPKEKQQGFFTRAGTWILLFIVVVAAGAIGKTVSREGFAWFRERQTDAEIDLAFSKAIVDLRATLPRKVDEHTTVIDVNYENKTMVYQGIVHAKKENLPSDFLSLVKANSVKTNCSNEKLKPALAIGISVRYSYQDEAGKPVGGFQVSQADCR